MAQRKLNKSWLNRCKLCFLRNDLCICSYIYDQFPEPVSSRIKVSFVMHIHEWRLPTNSARMMARALGSSIYLRGVRPASDGSENHFGEYVHLDVDSLGYTKESTAILFPSAEAQDFTEVAHSITHLIVPDGTWSQARRTQRRLPKDCLRVFIASPGESHYRLRKSASEGRVSTFEAVLKALELSNGPSFDESGKKLSGLFNEFVNRTLTSRGVRV